MWFRGFVHANVLHVWFCKRWMKGEVADRNQTLPPVPVHYRHWPLDRLECPAWRDARHWRIGKRSFP
jgi:hypothetical protein